MPAIYQARDITDASLLRDVLGQQGIAAHVRGGALQGGTGELPAGGLVAVWVEDKDHQAAKDVVARWERGEFALPEDSGDAGPTPAAIAPPAPRTRSALIAFFAGALLGGSLLWLTTRGPVEEAAVDYDEDGRIDERIFGSRLGLERVEADRNRDGRIDDIIYYKDNVAARSESDNDFDGSMETRVRYARNLFRDWESDWDQDGVVDYRMEADVGVLTREQWFDTEGNAVKQVLHAHGRPYALEFDRNGDGTFEEQHALDRYAERADR